MKSESGFCLPMASQPLHINNHPFMNGDIFCFLILNALFPTKRATALWIFCFIFSSLTQSFLDSVCLIFPFPDSFPCDLPCEGRQPWEQSVSQPFFPAARDNNFP